MPHLEDDIAAAFAELERLESSVDAQREKIGRDISEALRLGASWSELIKATGQTKARLSYYAKRSDPAFLLAKQDAKEEELARNREATAATQPGIGATELAKRVGISRAGIYNKIREHTDDRGPLVIEGWQLVVTDAGRHRFVPYEG